MQLWAQGIRGQVISVQGHHSSESGVGPEVSKASSWEGRIHRKWRNAKMNRSPKDNVEPTRTNRKGILGNVVPAWLH